MSQNYNCVAPEPFNFSNPGDWPKWIRRFERFRQASGLINNPENEQVNMLVYCMGDNADDILLSSLHSLAEHCNFGMLHDELIRDRIVVGVRDRALSERMQLDTDLTLVKATLMANQLESVKEQQSSLYQQDSIDQIKKMPNHIKETKRHEPKIRQFKSNQLGGSSHGCTRCGNSNNHDWKNCPAMNSYCSKCKKKGHYAKVCRSEAINEIKSEIAFLGSVEDNSKKWIVPIKVNNRQINFKIDTGADVNVLPLQYYYQSFQRIKLEKSDKILQGPNGIPLETVGMIHVKLQNIGQHLNSKIYIVDKLKQPLLSGETSEKLNIVRMIQQLSSGGRGGQRGRLGVEITEAATTAGKKATASLNVPNLPVVVDVAVDRAVMEAATTPATTAEKLATEENQRKSKKARYTCGEFGHKKDDCPKSGTQESGDEEESSDNKEEETPQKRKQAKDSEEEEVEAEEPPKKKSKKPKSKKKEEDCYLTLQAYRTMPLESARSREMRRPPLRHQPGSQGDARMTRSKRPRRIALHQRPHLQEMEGCRGTTKTRIQRRASLQCQPCIQDMKGQSRYLEGSCKVKGGDTPNEWPKWRKRFERYLVVSGMKKKEEAYKIDLLMYLIGDRADDIFRTFRFEKEEEATKFDSVLKAFDSHFCEGKNIIYELIRDRIVVGVRDKALSERMQLDSELTLEKAVKMVRQQEVVRQQQVDLQRPSTSQMVNQVRFNSRKLSPKQQQHPSGKKEKSAKTRTRCPKCGGFTHREGQACRAEGKRCNLCSKPGHFANCCPDKQAKTAKVKAVSELDEEIGFLLGVSAVEDSSNLDDDEGECRRRWTAEIQVNGKQVKFKLDSQADVTCVPLCLFKTIMGQQRLVESNINLRAAEFSELQTVGMFASTLRNGSYEIKERIYVIRRLSEPLLSRRACEFLNLARRIEVVATKINPIKEFPEVFEGLGQIGSPCEIKLKPGANPYAVHTPRRVPNFARQYGFTHVASSPRFPQSNGMAEAGVKIPKLILKKNQDPSLGLLECRSTPLENGCSPAELLMGSGLRTTLPIAPENLSPGLVYSRTLKRREERRRRDMKSRYDRRCGAGDMEELVKNEKAPAVDYPSGDSDDGQVGTRRCTDLSDLLHGQDTTTSVGSIVIGMHGPI
ncbi:hypothetical protein LAZ67_13000401 [Cordylochernes scorpioides]|uniref:CCHC-type domain-containing protein n=1 Tax=Cordylochernes scorpioides TaxID=51811 RepID=A0ABY6L6E4_9ARAC|nr:hypothetical protein LAZ67_13000401 [Cordylochernes scorpioides]